MEVAVGMASEWQLWQLDASVACEKDFFMPGELSVVDPIRNPK